VKILGALAYLISAALSCAFLFFTVGHLPCVGADLAMRTLMAVTVVVSLLRILEGLVGHTTFTVYREEYLQ
jgi:hypothetical protein